jgi:hypothetical protein
MHLFRGVTLEHIKSGLEAEYVAAIPTVENGFLHLLKSAKGYIYRLTGELEAEFKLPGEVQSLAQTGAGVSATETNILAELAQLREMLAAQNNAQGTATATPIPVASSPAPVVPPEPTEVDVPENPSVPSMFGPVDTAKTVPTDTPETSDTPDVPVTDAPEPVEPPADSIPF